MRQILGVSILFMLALGLSVASQQPHTLTGFQTTLDLHHTGESFFR